MQNTLDYYELLGVERDTSIDEIKKVYRRLARQHHPDLNPRNKAAEEKFKEIGEAYQVLSNSNSRAQYDQFGRDSNLGEFQKRPTGQLPSQQEPRANYNSGGYISKDAVEFGLFTYFNSFFDQLVGLGGSRKKGSDPTAPTSSRRDRFRPGTTKTSYVVPSRTRHRDMEAQLTISLSKAYLGGYARIRLSDGRSLKLNIPAATGLGRGKLSINSSSNLNLGFNSNPVTPTT